MENMILTFISVLIPIIVAKTIDLIISNYSKKLSRRSKPDNHITLIAIMIVIYAIVFTLFRRTLLWGINKFSISRTLLINLGMISLVISFILVFFIVMKASKKSLKTNFMKYRFKYFLSNNYMNVCFFQLITAVFFLEYILNYLAKNTYNFSNNMLLNSIILLFIYTFFASYFNLQFALWPIKEINKIKIIFMNGKEIFCSEVIVEKNMVCITRSSMNGYEQITNNLYVNKSSIHSIIHEKRYHFPVYNNFIRQLRKHY